MWLTKIDISISTVQSFHFVSLLCYNLPLLSLVATGLQLHRIMQHWDSNNFELIHMQQVTGSSHVGSKLTNEDVAANEGLHGGNRVALENNKYQDQATCGVASAGVGLVRLLKCLPVHTLWLVLAFS